MSDEDSKRTANWAITVVGGFCCLWTFLAWLRTTKQPVELPVVGDVTVGEAVIFSIPLIFLLLVILYVVVIFHNRHWPAASRRLERIPSAFMLSLDGPVLWVRCVVLFLFYVFPTAALLHFLIRLLGFQLTNVDTGVVLQGAQLWSFPEAWYDGSVWRWISDGARPSGYPGIQPALYTMMVVIAWASLVVYLIFLSRPLTAGGSTDTAKERQPDKGTLCD